MVSKNSAVDFLYVIISKINTSLSPQIKKSIFLKFFISTSIFFIILAGLILLLVFEQTPQKTLHEFEVNVLGTFFGPQNLLAIFILIICTSLIFSYLSTRSIALKTSQLKELARNIFEGRFDFSLPQEKERAEDEFAELGFWLKKIASSVKTQRELLQHEAEILNKRDVRLIQASTELKIERDKIRTLVENVAEGLILLNHQGEITLVNPWAEKITGLDKKELLGKKIETTPLDRKIVDVYLKQKNEAGNLIKQEISGVSTKDGQEQFFLITVVPISAQGDRQGACILSFHDVTREKMVEKMKSEFLSIAAHQLRTPLSAIKWIFHMLLNGDLGEITKTQREFVKKGYESNERMILLINDLLNVTRIEEGRFLFDFVKTSIKTMLDKLLEDFIPIAAKNKVKIEFNYPKIPLPATLVDEQKLELAFQNLIDNAIKYSPEGGTVKISLKKEKGFFLITISDEGVGIPRQQQGKIFNKFFRGSNVIKLETDGTGLGLFITKNIIEKHDGSISFVSQENQGTTFSVTLPIKNNLSSQEQEVIS